MTIRSTLCGIAIAISAAAVATTATAQERAQAPSPGPYALPDSPGDTPGIEVDEVVDGVRGELLRYRPNLSYYP